MLTWLHIGDLHVSHEDHYQGIERLREIVAEANRFFADAVDFVFLPGDNANNGTPLQYDKINDTLSGLTLPVYAIPGDHDFEPGSLADFYTMHGATPLPMVRMIDGRRCLFLDIVSAGSGGPDFRLGAEQNRWLVDQLKAAQQDAQKPVVFMHGYPGDLRQDSHAVGRLFADAGVAMVDTGHTHYNELLNDGAVIYASTRSTAQVEEDAGQAGYSIACLDGDAVSWHFKPLGSAWPFVMITSPADQRLATEKGSAPHTPAEPLRVRAKVFGEHVQRVTARIDDDLPVAMSPVHGEPGVWSAILAAPETTTPFRIHVDARDTDGNAAKDQVTVDPRMADPDGKDRSDAQPDTDAHAVRPWPEHGVLGTQLGPNKYGKKW
ncbi:putative phosphodiesterase [Rhodanobacter sp. ANJX3]|uniref:metallophosphoesterase family protein n=1 Tax=Rhodanobacter sp. ANJX3 TaxID=2723083 RepID=UPI00160E5534|nr:metallophosphoesterase [Rhodanobacter sp. ANJX3]MBB5357647.1 putative phosphodiesterase [Rhodanobacter sp. ANJX3]